MTATRDCRVRRGKVSSARSTVRVAIYTRKSVTMGLDQEFNSIDAQRAAVEAYVASQKGAGWIALPERYDDGGFSGAHIERPAFQRLLADVAAGKVDCIAVYRIDRLSRSFVDYVTILQLFEKHGVTFVSVTEHFNTTTPTGRLVMNQLILFAQFEREVTAERIRDKMQATRRRGMWTGGRPVLGYDAVDKKLVVNADEAQQVRAIFELYLERESLREAVAELGRRGWRNKSFENKTGRWTEGRAFRTATLHALLTNVLYRGQIRCNDETVAGVHEPLVAQDLWDAVQQRLQANGNGGGAKAKNKTGALLRGMLRCKRCDSAMVHTFSTRAGRRTRYYVCQKLHTEGASSCPGSRVPAGKFEGFIADQIRVIGTDEDLLAKTADAIERRAAEQQKQLDAELRRGKRDLRRLEADQQGGTDVQDQLRKLADRLAEARAEQKALDLASEAGLRAALAGFTPVWEYLFPNERERILRLLVQEIIYDPDTGEAHIDLRPTGITALAEEAGSTR